MKAFLLIALIFFILLLGSWLLSVRFDYSQRIFYYSRYSMQRLFGFHDLYDKIAKVFMNLEYRTIYYTYKDKNWRLEFWKGDYGPALGGEIGLYYRDASKHGKHYRCVSNKDMLTMCFKLYHKGTLLFTKTKARFWWANGFQFPYFKKINPADLSMHANLTFPDFASRTAFTEAYINTYGLETIQFSSDSSDNTVNIVF